MKEQYRVADAAKAISHLQFSLHTAEEMERQAHMQVVSRSLYTQDGAKRPVPHGVLDGRLGTSKKNVNCETCELPLAECAGHFGYVNLELPVFHCGYFKDVVTLLQVICKNCSRILLDDEECVKYQAALRRGDKSYLHKKALRKRVVTAAKKITWCSRCGHQNGSVKKAGLFRIIHNYSAKKVVIDKIMTSHVTEKSADLAKQLGTNIQVITPIVALEILRKVSAKDLPLLFMTAARPEDLIMQRISVPPVCIRPSVESSFKSSAGTQEDDITLKVTEIISMNDVIKRHRLAGAPMTKMQESWDFLQLQVALMINSETTGIPQHMAPKKPMRGLCQRLKGKQGRFRSNLSGKRVDFSSRTVISPDPNVRIDQVVVPVHVAKVLTYPERVTPHNLDRLRRLVIAGSEVHPGANIIQNGSDANRRFLRYGNLQKFADQLRPGDIVERHLCDGDVVLFNRQPSLHKLSMQAFYAKVMENRTFRFNECCCGPFNADFDGDEMNLHLPQTEEARAEALVLMGSKSNMVTPRSGEPLIAAIQDFITGAWLLTNKDVFMSRAKACQLLSSVLHGGDYTMKLDLPPPAIMKPAQRWTGKQLFSLIMRPNSDIKLCVNLRTKGRNYTGNEEMCVADSFVLFHNSELLCGQMEKNIIGGGTKANLIYVILRDAGEEAVAVVISRLCRLVPAYLTHRGFSIGLGDVTPDAGLLTEKAALLASGYAACGQYIDSFKQGTLQSQPGCTPEETLESMILRELSVIRDHAGRACLRRLHKTNAPLNMALSGSKGSQINISQMVACVGQQALSGRRVPDGFSKRSLPHFARHEKSPEAKGFVADSFYSGLTPSEFFFHTMGGREGLVDTAVKTAETGYMQRRLVKCLEDLCVHYDKTVRTATSEVVQFIYGADGLDPTNMEGNSKPIDFTRILERVRAEYPCKNEVPIAADQIRQQLDAELSSEKFSQIAVGFTAELRQVVEQFAARLAKWSAELTEDSPPVTRQVQRLTKSQLEMFFSVCQKKYLSALIEPGTAIGATCAQSIGEPGTQMTLKTFHFAGVASMNITLGVPRIKEIINAAKKISTPIITAQLLECHDMSAARVVKGRLERTILGEVTEWMEDVYLPTDCALVLRLSASRVKLLQLAIDAHVVQDRIYTAKMKSKLEGVRVLDKWSLAIVLEMEKSSTNSITHALRLLKEELKQVVVSGFSTVSRAVIHADEKTGKTFSLLIEGQGLLKVLGCKGVDAARTTSNHVAEVESALGVEAARATIMKEIDYTMSSHGMAVDSRHVMLLADLMTTRGEVLGITRGGLAKMKESVLMLASFEKTTDHLFEAAYHGQEDAMCGVSECIIMGIPTSLGSGLMKIVQQVERKPAVKRACLFDTPQFHTRESRITTS